MAMKGLEQKMNEVLASDPVLVQRWTDPPQAFVDLPLPYPPTQNAIVWLCVGQQDLSVERLWNIIREVVRKVSEAGCLNDLRRIDIVPRFYEPGGRPPERLVRLNIDVCAIGPALQLQASSLLRREPVPGVVCGWYVQPEDLPSLLHEP